VMLLKDIQIGPSQGVILGCFLMLLLITVTTLIAIKLKFSFKYLIYLFFALISPPILLLLERGNLDSLVFILLVGSVFLLMKNRPTFAFAALAITSLIKFYTFPLLLFFLYDYRRKRFKAGPVIPILICLAWIIQDLERVKAEYIEITTASFGVSIPLIWFFNLDPGGTPSKLYSLLAFIVLVYLTARVLPKVISNSTLQKRLDRDFLALGLFTSCSIVHIIVSLIAINFSYRLIYLIFAVILLPFVIDPYFGKFEMFMRILLFLGLWFSFNVGKFEFIGQLSIYLLTVFLSVVLIQFIKEIIRPNNFQS
jgi:hypothetical protein